MFEMSRDHFRLMFDKVFTIWGWMHMIMSRLPEYRLSKFQRALPDAFGNLEKFMGVVDIMRIRPWVR